MIKPLVGRGRDVASDAVVMRPVLDSSRGLAVTQALNPFYSEIDTYRMTAATIDEAVRRVLAVGGDPEHLGGVDNFCWPTIQYDPLKNPDGKYKAAQLVRANWALRDTVWPSGFPSSPEKTACTWTETWKALTARGERYRGCPPCSSPCRAS